MVFLKCLKALEKPVKSIFIGNSYGEIEVESKVIPNRATILRPKAFYSTICWMAQRSYYYKSYWSSTPSFNLRLLYSLKKMFYIYEIDILKTIS